MREYVQSLRAIFACWQQGEPLRFEGEHYRFTRMQPFFKPDPLVGAAPPPIYLGGIGPAMTALAGEAAEGLMTHPTNSAPRYLREVMLPRLAKGAGRVGRDPAHVELMVGPLYAAGPDEADVIRGRGEARQLLGFLFSTPAYWPSLELFGWKERGERLHALTREGRWAEMNEVIDDAMLDALVMSAPYAEMAARLRESYGALARWITFPMPADPAHDAEAGELVAELRGV
jgi:probable F420-dependent oxidoreductase